MAQLQRRQDAVTCGNNLYGLSKFIGERERANLVVQLAIYIYMGAVTYRNVVHISKSAYNCHNVDFAIHRPSRNVLHKRQRNFTYTVSRACANIYHFALTGHLYYSWQVLRIVGGTLEHVVGLHIPVLHSSTSCSTPPSFFASWIAPARQQCSTFC